MGKRWAIALATWVTFAGLAGACSSSTSSEGVVSTTAAADDGAASVPATAGATDDSTDDSSDAGSEATDAPVASGGTITVGLDSEPPTLDPAGNSLSLANGSVYAAIYETLFSFTPEDATPQPVLADSITESEDRLSWTLTLKSGITFHDGTPFDAAAVAFNLERQKASPYNGSGLIPLTAIDVVDPLTATLTLSEPWTALPSVLAGINGVMVSPAAAADTATFQRNPVGTGPYRFVEWVPTDKVVTERYEGYWGDPAPLDQLVFKFVAVEAARVAAFEGGELDAYTTIIDDTADAARDDGAQVVSPPPTGYGYAYINVTKPPFDDVRVRTALQLAVDRDAIANAYQGQGYADFANSPFVKDSEWWVAPETPLRYDPDEAKRLVADYGQPVSVEYKLLAGSQEIEDAIRATVDYWIDAGIDAELQLVPDLGTYITDVLTGNYDVLGFVGGSIGDPDSVVYNIFHSGGALNYGKYSNPEMDAALEDGRRSKDDAERKADYATVQQILREDVPVLLTSHGKIYIVASERVGGLEPSFYFPSRTVNVAA
ncbi:MAG: ABC transporter substrate-binding protein [Acidimicrobiia bacterium]